jgi:hypothetical protein
MKTRRKTRISNRWRRADHKFAIATISLMLFFLVMGFSAWLLDEKPSAAMAGSTVTVPAIR